MNPRDEGEGGHEGLISEGEIRITNPAVIISCLPQASGAGVAACKGNCRRRWKRMRKERDADEGEEEEGGEELEELEGGGKAKEEGRKRVGLYERMQDAGERG